MSRIRALGDPPISIGLWLLLGIAAPVALDAQQFRTAARLCIGAQGSSVALGDLDGDGDLDVVFGMGRHEPEPNLIYLNNGKGVFYGGRSWTLGAAAADKTKVVRLGDMDGDGDLDVVAGNWGTQDNVVLNSGSARFTDKRSFGPALGYTIALAVGDVDGDADLDIVTSALVTWLNDGAANFTEAQRFKPAPRELTTALALADMDADGDLDLLVGQFNAQSRIYLNDGRGTFTPGPELGAPTDMVRSIVVGDVDGDGDLDIATANACESNAIYFNARP